MKEVEEKIAFENLANAIVEQAVNDYKKAYLAYCRNPYSSEKRAKLDTLRVFFRSDWCAILTKLDMQRVIRIIEKQIDEIRRCTL